MDTLGTAYGLALTSGINAYLPLLSLSIAARWFNLFPISQNFGFITQPGFIIALIILAILDIIADKIPFVDSIWDSIHTILRPIAGAIVVGAINEHLGIGLPISFFTGAVLALMSHMTKAVTRLTASVSSAGCANFGLSLLEDAVVLVTIMLAYFAPIVMLVVAGIFTLLFIVFAPMMFSALSYRLRIAFSLFSWFVRSYFWRGAESGTSDFLLELSDMTRGILRQVLPSEKTILGGVKVQWVRKLDGRGLWGSRRVALPTCFMVAEGVLIVLPTGKPHLTQVVPFNDVRALVLDQGLLMGSVRILTAGGQAINLTVLRNDLESAVDLVETLHMRYRLPYSATSQLSGTRTRTVGPQRI